MKKQRRNIRASVRIGGVEILFGLVFLLLPLMYELNDQIKKEKTGFIEYVIYPEHPDSLLQYQLRYLSFKEKKLITRSTISDRKAVLVRIDEHNNVSFDFGDSTVSFEANETKKMEMLCENLKKGSQRFWFEIKSHPESRYQLFISLLNQIDSKILVAHSAYDEPPYFTQQYLNINHRIATLTDRYKLFCGTSSFSIKEKEIAQDTSSLKSLVYQVLGINLKKR